MKDCILNQASVGFQSIYWGKVFLARYFYRITGAIPTQQLAAPDSLPTDHKKTPGLEELGVAGKQVGGADAIVLCSDDAMMGRYHAIADELRATGLRIDVFPECRKPGQQYGFAEKKAIPVAVIVDGTGDTVTVRDLRTRTNTEGLSVSEAARAIRGVTA